MANFEHNIHVETIVVGDDIAVAEPDGSMPGKRRGVAYFFAYKCAGAAQGMDLKRSKM